jgi:cytochrome c
MKRASRRHAAAFALCASVSSGFAIAPLAAQEPASATLLPGKGSALTMAKCAICHDITHVTRTRLSRDEWDDNIKVMIARGMPIEPHEIPVVLEYLSTYYNRDKPPPPADASPATTQTGATTPDALAATLGCTACHASDRKIVGPSFREIAARYKGDGSATARLAGKVKEGGSGAWGPVPMPPHPQVRDADLQAIIGWVLQQN